MCLRGCTNYELWTSSVFNFGIVQVKLKEVSVGAKHLIREGIGEVSQSHRCSHEFVSVVFQVASGFEGDFRPIGRGVHWRVIVNAKGMVSGTRWLMFLFQLVGCYRTCIVRAALGKIGRLEIPA